jgi:hypothetical protein
MKNILLFAALASTSFSTVAHASFCASQPAYDVTVGGVPVGKATFKPGSVKDAGYSTVYAPESLCGYTMTWKDPTASAPNADASCNVAQLSVFNQSACGADPNAATSPGGPLLSGSGCQGFDPSGAIQALSFMLSSGGPECGMNGLATYSLYPYALQAITFE